MGEYLSIPEWNGKDFVRFWTKVRMAEENECWVWTSSQVRGYGQFSLGGRDGVTVLAHRMAWAMSHRTHEIPLHVLHKCDNPSCVNPIHLFLGDDAANVADCIAKGRDCRGEKMTVALLGHMPRGTKHHNVILDEEKVRLIRRLYAEGESSWAQLGRQFGVTQSTIQAIIQRRTWKWLD